MKSYGFYIVIFTLLFFKNNYAQESTQFSLSDFEKITDTLIFNEEIKDLRALSYNKKVTLTIAQVDQLITIAEQLKSNIGLAYAYYIKGTAFAYSSTNKTVTFDLKKALHYFLKVKDTAQIGILYYNLGANEYKLGSYAKSGNYFIQAKKYIKEKDSLIYSVLHNGLGNTYAQIHKKKEAIAAFQKCVTYSEGISPRWGSLCLGNLARQYKSGGNLDLAIDTFKKAIQLAKQDETRRNLPFVYLSISELYLEKKEYEIAKNYVDSGVAASKRNKYEHYLYRNLTVLTMIEVELGNYGKAKKLLNETLLYFEKERYYDGMKMNYNMYVQIDSARGNLNGAMGWLRKIQKLDRIVLEENSSRDFKNIKEDYQNELKNLELIHQQKMNDHTSKAEIFRLRIYTILIVIGLLIGFYFLFTLINARKKRKKLIQDLKESNQVKNKLFSIISHDLKNEIFSLNTSLSLLSKGYMSTKEFKDILPLMVQRTNHTSILLNNLLNWSKSQMNELSAKPVNFDIKELITTKFMFFKPKAAEKSITLLNELHAMQVYADKDMVGIIAQNLIANAVKFCDSGDSITLLSVDKEKYLEIKFSDTGVGIAPENITKLFAEDTFTTKGTSNESGTGLGLKICKELVELNQGSIHVDSRLGEGTTFSVLLPKQRL